MQKVSLNFSHEGVSFSILPDIYYIELPSPSKLDAVLEDDIKRMSEYLKGSLIEPKNNTPNNVKTELGSFTLLPPGKAGVCVHTDWKTFY